MFIIAAASRQSGSAILEVFYPQRPLFYIGLMIGLLPLSRLLLTTPWQRVALDKQQLLFMFVCCVDLAIQVHILLAQHGRFSWAPVLSLWFTLMLAWLLGKELLTREHNRSV